MKTAAFFKNTFVLKSLSLLFIFSLALISCVKDENFPVPESNSGSTQTDTSHLKITKLEVLNCNFLDCLTSDADTLPDIYIRLVTFSGLTFYSSVVTSNSSHSQFPLTFTFASPIILSANEGCDIYIMDKDGTTLTSNLNDNLGWVQYYPAIMAAPRNATSMALYSQTGSQAVGMFYLWQ